MTSYRSSVIGRWTRWARFYSVFITPIFCPPAELPFVICHSHVIPGLVNVATGLGATPREPAVAVAGQWGGSSFTKYFPGKLRSGVFGLCV